MVDGGEVAAFEDVIAAHFFADLIEDAMRLGEVPRSLCLAVVQNEKRVCQQIVALSQKGSQTEFQVGVQIIGIKAKQTKKLLVLLPPC